MIKIENVEVWGFRGALRGMRNPLNSWHLADTEYDERGYMKNIGINDLRLVERLTSAGDSHRKMLRMIHVQMDITAPLYWWKDYDTYKVATVANGCSTMHKIHAKEFELEDFSHEHLGELGLNVLYNTIGALNYYRQEFLNSGMRDKNAWHNMIQMLPTSYMQKRTVDLSYETILKLIMDRENHKLFEFRDLCEYLKMELPLMKEVYESVKR